MTENEAKRFLKIEKECINRNCDRNCAQCDLVQKVEDLNSAYDAAIKALEENQRWHISEVNPSIKNVFANMSTQICHNCDHKDEYIEELEAEIQQYRAIGTVEECRAAVEKQTAKKPDYEGDGYADGHLVYDTWICPCCGKHYEVDYDNYNYCPDCGQKLDWSDEE